MEVICIPLIISLVYGIVELLKLTFKSEKFLNYIPIISAGLGVTLSVVSFYLMPNLIPANNLLCAIFIGLTSGLSATGSNQIVKQMLKLNNKTAENTGENTENTNNSENSENN